MGKLLKISVIAMVAINVAGCSTPYFETKEWKNANFKDEIPDFAALAKKPADNLPHIEDQLLRWHPYGSPFEPLKARIISGGAELSRGSPTKVSCQWGEYRHAHCEGIFYIHSFFTDDFYIVVGEQNGKVVHLNAKYRMCRESAWICIP